MGKKKTRGPKKTKQNKKSKKQLIIGFLIVFLMASSGFGIMFSGFSSETESQAYKDLSFTRTNDGFQTTINEKPFKAYYLPQEVESINVSDEIIQSLASTKQIDVTSDPDSPAARDIAVAQFYLTDTASRHMNTYVRNGFTKENPHNISIINCSSQVPVLVYQVSDETRITNEGSCIHLYGSGADSFMRMTTRLVYGMLGVI
ncbi:MAG: hypothetical protein R6V53_03810 [Candidatus Woesearchaeota archaeon]